jgi:uncharacterized protein
MDGITRRTFLRHTVAGAALTLAPWEEALAQDSRPLPRRTLGKTGVKVPILAFGSAPAGARLKVEEAVKLFHEALSLGVNYMDTAPEFTGYGKAQNYLGHALQGRRKEVFLVTKCFKPRADDALKLLEANLKELRTDHADLVYAHSVGDSQMPLKTIIGKGGVMEFLKKAQKEGLTRFVGISGHSRPGKFLTVLKAFDVDVMMNAVNLVDKHTYDFEGRVWPAAARKNIGLVAMKVFGGQYGNSLSNTMMPNEHRALAFRYALSQPHVVCACIGMATSEELRRNVAWAKSFTPLTKEERASLDTIGRKLAQEWKTHFGPVV